MSKSFFQERLNWFWFWWLLFELNPILWEVFHKIHFHRNHIKGYTPSGFVWHVLGSWIKTRYPEMPIEEWVTDLSESWVKGCSLSRLFAPFCLPLICSRYWHLVMRGRRFMTSDFQSICSTTHLAETQDQTRFNSQSRAFASALPRRKPKAWPWPHLHNGLFLHFWHQMLVEPLAKETAVEGSTCKKWPGWFGFA